MKRLTLAILLIFLPLTISLAEGIGSAAELAAYAQACNEGSSLDDWISPDGAVRLTSDIDMSKIKKMPQILSFDGVLDGCGHSIKGWKTALPLIRTISAGAIVRNLIIAEDCVLKPSAKGNPLRLGFIAAENCGTIHSCRNDGSINFKCGFASIPISVGGLVGENCYIMTDCANCGTIKVDASGDQNVNELPCNVGGIAGATGEKASDVAFIGTCINLGAINLSSDFPVQNVGGIIGNSAKRIIKYCVNKGSVSCFSPAVDGAKEPSQSKIGGIAGFTKGDIMACDNFGEISASGASMGCVGGIVGMPHAALVVGDCVNYGAVSSANEGGSYSGGIAGNVGRPVHFKRCINRGAADKGIAGNVYKKKGITEDAYFRDCADLFGKGKRKLPEWADGTKPLTNGANLYGQVLSSDGEPLAGVVVSDGRGSVCTGADGTYMMKSDLGNSKFVQISLPAEYQIPTMDGMPVFFRRIPRWSEAVRADFVLSRRTQINDDYTIAMVGDPQVRPTGMDGSMEAWKNDVSIDVENLRKTTDGEFYCINLGDLVYNYMYAYDDYLDAAAQIKCPTFNVIGNHDYDQKTMLTAAYGQIYYQTYIGPVNYSFNIGRIHFVMVNDILYDRTDTSITYNTGLDDQSLEWLKSDLRYVPTDRTIVICGHAQLFKKRGTTPVGSFGGHNRNYQQYCELLSQYKNVYSWSGHYHRNFLCDYSIHPEYAPELSPDNVKCVCVARCTGALRLNKYLGADGTPQGYMVVNVKGDSLDWAYKSVGRDISFQMKLYSPSRSKDGCLKALVWNWGDGWSLPELWKNGSKVCTLEYSPEPDPDYLELYATVTNQKTRKYCAPDQDCQIFKAPAMDFFGQYEVRVKDNFGKEYHQTITF